MYVCIVKNGKEIFMMLASAKMGYMESACYFNKKYCLRIEKYVINSIRLTKEFRLFPRAWIF